MTTLLPVDKVIGRFYPFFALLLIFVTFSLLVCLFRLDREWFSIQLFTNMHPVHQPIFPLMFITIACGALSGFHATQSPIMARCISNEKDGRLIFYGAMILEGFIALVWATLGLTFYDNPTLYYDAITKLGQGGVVAEISKSFLGNIGSILTVLAVVVLSITSGDTAFRSARLTLSNALFSGNKSILTRFILSIIVLSIGIAFTLTDITTLWLYFGWANQTLATISLWGVSVWLKKKNKLFYISLVPALFMTAVCSTYILNEKIGFNIDMYYAKILSIILTSLFLILFFVLTKKK